MTASSSTPKPGRGDRPEVPPGINTGVAHPARMYDYYLGGKNNFPADREAAERMIAAAPGCATAPARTAPSWDGRCAGSLLRRARPGRAWTGAGLPLAPRRAGA